jgi:hypothetical protein
MKKPIFLTMFVVALATALTVATASAQDSPSAGTQIAAPAPVHLDYAAGEVAKLAQAKVNDDTIIAYINSSGNLFNLSADQIIYLKQLGASDAVVKAMLAHPTTSLNTTPAAAPAASTTVDPSVANASVPVPSTPAPQVTSTAPQVTTVVAQPPVTYVQTVPSTYYSYPYPYYGYPYYGGYYGYPVVSFGWGGRWGGGWRGGGGWHR